MWEVYHSYRAVEEADGRHYKYCMERMIGAELNDNKLDADQHEADAEPDGEGLEEASPLLPATMAVHNWKLPSSLLAAANAGPHL